jgi:AcrR family transcriptional regulator
MNITKNRIKNTAMRLFLTKGYSVGINEIIEKAGTSKGAFYHHFKSKEDLFIETVDDFFFAYLDDAKFSEVDKYPLGEKINSLIRLTFEPFRNVSKLVGADKEVNILNLFAEYPRHRILRKKNEEHFKQFIEVLTEILNEAVESGEIRRKINIHTLCFHIGMLIDGSIVDSLLMYNDIQLAEEACLLSVNQLIDLLLD